MPATAAEPLGERTHRDAPARPDESVPGPNDLRRGLPRVGEPGCERVDQGEPRFPGANVREALEGSSRRLDGRTVSTSTTRFASSCIGIPRSMCAPIRRYLLPEHRLSSPRLHIAFVVSDERSEPTGWRPEDELPLRRARSHGAARACARAHEEASAPLAPSRDLPDDAGVVDAPAE
jgi:hypothetical protein